MTSKNIKGVLVDSANAPISNATIRFTSTSTDSVLNSVETDYHVGVDGSYDFLVLFGVYTIQIKRMEEVQFRTVCANALVLDTSISTLEHLIQVQEYIQDLNPELIQQMMGILTQTNTAKDTAVAAAINADASADAALVSETHAAASAALAYTKAAESSTSASTAITKATEASTSAANAAASATTASTKASEASTSATAATGAAATATIKAGEASVSAANVLTSETNAKASELIAHTKAGEASVSAANALTSETNAKVSELAAESDRVEILGYKDSALASSQQATTAADAASLSAAAAHVSELAAAASKQVAAMSETNADASADAALVSETNAAASALLATTKASEASTSASSAATSATTATNKATEASSSATNAASSATTATNKATEASTSAANALTSETNADASASLASTKASVAASSAQEAAQYAAVSMGGLIESGSADLSSGVYPTPIKDAIGNSRACFWKVTVGGTIGAEVYGVGDSLVYSKELSGYYKIDSTESVTSVNGKQGVVVLSKADVGLANADNTSDVNKPVSTATQSLLDLKVDKITTINSKSLSGNIVLTPYDVDAAPASHMGSGGSTHTTATTSVAGFMSSADKTKIDNALLKNGNLEGLAAPDTALDNLGLTPVGKAVAKAVSTEAARTTLGAPISVATSADVNTLTSPGFYDVAKGSLNWASSSSGGAMTVLAQGSYVTQLAQVGGASSLLIRSRPGSDAAWTAWTKVYSEAAKPTASEIGAELAGVAETQMQQHEAKEGAHAIAGVLGLGAELNSITQSIIAVQKLAAASEAGSYRNKIVDGRSDFWHEGTSQTTSGYGSDTMWMNLHSGSTKTHSRLAMSIGESLPNIENPSALYASRTVVSSVTGASNYVRKIQKIEGARTLAGKKATLSFYAKADAAKDLGVHIEQSFGTIGSPSAINMVLSTKLSITDQWVRYSLTFDIPSIAGKVFGRAGNDSLNVIFGFDHGSSFSALMGGLGHQSGTFDIACVQLEEGEKATKFEELPLSMAAAMVGRYFETSYPIGTPIGTPSYMLGAVTVCHPKSTINVYGASTIFKYEKVVTPVVSLRSTGEGTYNTVLNITTVNTGKATAKDISPIGFAYIQLFNTPAAANDFQFHYVADARL